jgi:GT2 family glycosyltransferase
LAPDSEASSYRLIPTKPTMAQRPKHRTTGPRPSVQIIVLNWNGWQDTVQCLEALDGLRYPAVNVLVVDNGSTDDSEMELRTRRPDLEIIQAGGNLGYAGGNNLGLKLALERGVEFAWILNNDTSPEASALEELIACMARDERVGVLASRVRSPDGEDQQGIAFSTTDARAWTFSGVEGEISCAGCPAAGDFHEAAIVAGPSLFIRAEALSQVGFFDETYFHFFEEMDLVERLRAGQWGAGLACRSIVRHKKGAALSHLSLQAQYYLYRNHLAYRRKRFGVHPLRVLAHRPIWHLRNLVSLGHSVRGDFRPLRTNWWAIVDALRERGGPRDLGPDYRSEWVDKRNRRRSGE